MPVRAPELLSPGQCLGNRSMMRTLATPVRRIGAAFARISQRFEFLVRDAVTHVARALRIQSTTSRFFIHRNAAESAARTLDDLDFDLVGPLVRGKFYHHLDHEAIRSRTFWTRKWHDRFSPRLQRRLPIHRLIWLGRRIHRADKKRHGYQTTR